MLPKVRLAFLCALIGLLNACIGLLPAGGEGHGVPLIQQLRSLAGNLQPPNCVLNAATPVSGAPYLLVKFKGAILDLVAATFQCHNTTLIRYCDPGTRLRYLGHNGYFSSNFLAGDPANPGNRNPEVTYQLFAGDAASYDPSFPVVQLYFWCQDQAGTITDAKDPTLYEPPTAMPGT